MTAWQQRALYLRACWPQANPFLLSSLCGYHKPLLWVSSASFPGVLGSDHIKALLRQQQSWNSTLQWDDRDATWASVYLPHIFKTYPLQHPAHDGARSPDAPPWISWIVWSLEQLFLKSHGSSGPTSLPAHRADSALSKDPYSLIIYISEWRALTISHLWSLPGEFLPRLNLRCIYMSRQHKQAKMHSEIEMKVLQFVFVRIRSYTFVLV